MSRTFRSLLSSSGHDLSCHGYHSRVSTGLRIVIASYGPAQFRCLDETLTSLGHTPVAYLTSRSMRPGTVADPYLVEATKAIVADLPAARDLLLPASPAALAGLLGVYQPDVLLVFGFNWRLPPDALAVPKVGAVNVHPSALPKYRGPSPVLWAIRNGDPYLGLTVHRMTGRIDAGPVLAQLDDLPLPDQVTREDDWRLRRHQQTRPSGSVFDAGIRGFANRHMGDRNRKR